MEKFKNLVKKYDYIFVGVGGLLLVALMVVTRPKTDQEQLTPPTEVVEPVKVDTTNKN